ncbi:MAG: hypothetical protein KIC73_14310 [Clostridiales bacterium]|nr:hypothetical protein [Clostridiales bacterium]
MNNKYILVEKWLENLCNNRYWSEYLSRYNYNKIAIYGAGDLGRYLTMELKDSKIDIICFVDIRAKELITVLGHPVITLDDFINNYNYVDALIVSVPSVYDELMNKIVEEIPEMPVMSLKDMLYEF